MRGASRTIAFVVAAGLLVLIAWRVMVLLQLRERESHLAELEAVAARGDVVRGLQQVNALDDLTEKQEQRRRTAILALVEKALSSDCPVRKVAGEPFSMAGSKVYHSRFDEVTVEVILKPMQLRRFVRGIRLGGEETLFAQSDATLAARHRLQVAGREERVPVVALLEPSLGGEAGDIVLHEGLRLVHDVTPPTLAIVHGAKVRDLEPGENADNSLKLGPEESFSLRVSDTRGVSWIQWQIDGAPASKKQEIFDAEALKPRREVAVDPALFPVGRSVILLVTAQNGLENRGAARLKVSRARANPVARVLLDGEEVSASQADPSKSEPMLLGSRRGTVRVELHPGESGAGLSVSVRKQPFPLVPRNDAWEADVDFEPGNPTAFAVLRDGKSLGSYRVQVDVTPPVVSLRISGRGDLAEDVDSVEVSSEAKLVVTVTDAYVAPWDDQEVEVKGLEEAASSETGGRVTREYRLPEEGEASLLIQGVDRAGNRSEARRLKIRVGERLKMEKVRLGNRPWPSGSPPHFLNSGEIELLIKASGRGEVWVQLEGEGLARGGQIARLTFGDEAEKRAVIPLGVQSGEVAERVIALVDPEGRTLRSAGFTVDRRAPRLTIGGEHAGAGGIVRRAVTPGQRLEVVAEDESGLRQLEAEMPSGEGPRTEGTGNTARLEITAPSTLPVDLRVWARDRAENVASLDLKLIDGSAPPPVITRVYLGSRETSADGPLRVTRLTDLRFEVENGSVTAVSFGGQPISIVPGASVGLTAAPDPLPDDRTLVVTVRSATGEPSTLRYAIAFETLTLTEEEAETLDAIERLAAVSSPDVAALQDRVAEVSRKLTRSRGRFRLVAPEVDAAFTRLEAVTARLQEGARRAAVTELDASTLAATLTNPRDRAEFVLVRPRQGGTAFRPFYLCRTEVTVAMYRRFLEDAGRDPEFWKSVRGVRGEAAANRLRARAQGHIDVRIKGRLPVVGLDRRVIEAYLQWADAGLPGRLRLPTVEEWRLAAGRAEVPAAVYPSTGAFPDGNDLKDHRFKGERGGAAFGFPRLQRSGSYAPGRFGLSDMAGNAAEWVTSRRRWRLIGGATVSDKVECGLDAPAPKSGAESFNLAGFRPVLEPESGR